MAISNKFIDISTERGAQRIVFTDAKGQTCSMQKSNSNLEEKIWVGVDKDFNGKVILGRMELTQEQVSQLFLPNKICYYMKDYLIRQLYRKRQYK